MRPLCIFVLLIGCTSSDFELSVDALSDLQPGAEVDRIELRLDDVVVFDGLPTRPLADGARLVDLEVSGGDHVVTGQAFFRGVMVAERRVLVQVRQDQGVTVVLTRNCRDIECGAESTCANATCVDPQCSPETPQFCEPAAQCEFDTDCEAAGVCGAVACRLGACLLVDDGRCGAGFFCAGEDGCVVAPLVVDAGMPDANVGDAGPDVSIASDSGNDVPVLPDTGPSRTCPEPWGTLPVNSAAVVGGDASPAPTPTLSVTPSSALLAPTMTMDMWVRFLAPESTMYLLGNATRDSGGFDVRVLLTPGGDPRVVYGMEGNGFLIPAPGLTDGCWHHIALVRDLEGGVVTYVQDGAAQSLTTDARSTPVAEGEAGLYVGRTAFGDSFRAHVAIHHLRFWSVALSEAELIALSTTEAPIGDPRLIDAIPMQTVRRADGLDHLDSRGTLDAFLGWWGSVRGNAPGTLMTLGELDIYASGF